MKLKEYIDTFKKLIKSTSLVILRCPYCDSVDINYFKTTLEEKEIVDSLVKKNIHYGIGCNNCNAVAIIDERWNDSLREEK